MPSPMAMRTILPAETAVPDLHQYLIGSVSPRPIAFVSSLSADGIPNLAPYSFFNVFSSQPPTLIFSTNRRVRDNTTKDTLSNVQANREVVINVVSHAIVHQMTIASVEFPSDVSEFEKSGLTPLESEVVKPFRVAESPVQMECKVVDIIALGDQGGAGNLVLCEMLRMHIDEAVLDDQGKIDPHKIDLMGRMGRAFYDRASGESVFPIVRQTREIPLGVDGLPASIRESHILSGNDLARLGGVQHLPSKKDGFTLPEGIDASLDAHSQAKALIQLGDIDSAWQVLLSA